LDLLPSMSAGELLAELQEHCRLPLLLEDFLTGILNKRLGQQLIKLLDGRSLAMPAASLSNTDLQRLAGLIKALPLPVSG
ncbi:MAG: NAD(P)/FAD-dependent oxidoreductase, partial [Firmicutes bacterium]|nr:NAD(P)/FAD-dependent oxidoreductase [Bacillota bacterium]